MLRLKVDQKMDKECTYSSWAKFCIGNDVLLMFNDLIR